MSKFTASKNSPELTLKVGECQSQIASTLSVLGRSIAGYDFFISYSWDSISFAEELEKGLVARDFAVFRDANQIHAGDLLKATIGLALRRTRTLIVIGSQGALTSKWVRDEIALFSKRRRSIIPLDTNGVLKGQSWWMEDIPLFVKVDAAAPISAVLDEIDKHHKGMRRNRLARMIAWGIMGVMMVLR